MMTKSKLLRGACAILIAGFFYADPASAQSTNDGAGKKPSNFTGTPTVKMYTEPKNPLNCSMGSVSFPAGARTNWHKHPGGQILMVSEGTGFYQERGAQKRIIRKGDVISCSPNIEHWHGAAADSAMTHLAVGPNTDKGAVIWLEKVTDSVYLK